MSTPPIRDRADTQGESLPTRIWTVEEYYRAKDFYEGRGLIFNPALIAGSPAAHHVLAQFQLRAAREASMKQGMTKQCRFDVGLSYPGEHREFVGAVADELARTLGRVAVFYDRFHEAELARPNLDTYLQRIYHDDSELLVVFICADYERKEWCGLEWRAIRDLIKRKEAASIMPIRLDAGDVSGLFSIDGYLDAKDRTPAEVAKLIRARLDNNRNKARP